MLMDRSAEKKTPMTETKEKNALRINAATWKPFLYSFGYQAASFLYKRNRNATIHAAPREKPSLGRSTTESPEASKFRKKNDRRAYINIVIFFVSNLMKKRKFLSYYISYISNRYL